MKISKVLNIVLWVLLVVSAVLMISLIGNISENDADPTMGAWINTNLIWVYILLAIGAVTAVLFALTHMVTDKKALKGGLISLVFLAVVGFIAYALADGSIPSFHGVEKFVSDGTLTETVSKWIGTTLYGTYILLIIAVLAMFASPIFKLFK